MSAVLKPPAPAALSPFQAAARDKIWSMPLADLHPADPQHFVDNVELHIFDRLRAQAPVHFGHSPVPEVGSYWSVTRYQDIMHVDTHPELFSSDWSKGGITLFNAPDGEKLPMFIAMDPPKHDLQRQAVQNVVAPQNLKELEGLIRSRVQEVLDQLPVDQPFDWVENVSIELTARMLATLLDFPYDQRHQLVYWSDLIAGSVESTGGTSDDMNEMFLGAADMAKQFSSLWHRKAVLKAAGAPIGYDLISLMQSNEATQDLIRRPMEFMGNLALLIVGGNDTTRNSMTGGVYALSLFPQEFTKLKDNPSLIPNMVSEIIRWQTPLAYMRRIAKQDVELNGQTIKKGDKVVMWYVSGNRDERVIERPDELIIDRKGARNHLSFGFGVHRCMGNRLAEMQLRILWEELLVRFEHIEVLSEPEIVQSNFVRGYAKMMVRLKTKKNNRKG